MTYRNLGGPIVLGVIGLILATAVRDNFGSIDLSLIGWLIAAGALLWLLIVLFVGDGPMASRTVVRRRPERVVRERPVERVVDERDVTETEIRRDEY